MSLPFKYKVTGKNITITRRYGETVEASEEIIFDGDVQSMDSRTIMSLTEGRLSSGMVTVFSETPLIVPREGSDTTGKGTHVLFEGDWYEIVTGDSMNTQISELASINHYEYQAEYRYPQEVSH